MIPYSKQQIIQSDIDAVCEALKGDYLTGGKNVDEFENALCKYLGVKHVIVMNSATSALHVGYKILDIKQGDEVITTPITFAATANAALMCGGEVVFCDVKNDGNIDENCIEKLITNKTKVISVVDFGGNSVEIDTIIDIAKRHGLKVLDDASHALGSEINNKKVGTQADINIFSFHAIKPITTFEGGAIATNDDEFARLAKLYRSHGITKLDLWDSDMSLLGYNYRLSDVACALGKNQLKRLDTMIAKREEIAQFYNKSFADNEFFNFIPIPENKKSSRHLYPILLDDKFIDLKKEIFTRSHNLNIGVQVHYKPTYTFSFYKQKYKNLYLKNAEKFYTSELSLPCHQGMSIDDANYVCENLFKILKELI